MSHTKYSRPRCLTQERHVFLEDVTVSAGGPTCETSSRRYAWNIKPGEGGARIAPGQGAECDVYLTPANMMDAKNLFLPPTTPTTVVQNE